MAENIGVYPLDPTSEVGKFRLGTGDVTSVPLDPPQVGFESYAINSDEEIENFLAMGGGSQLRGIGYWYLSLSGAAALESKAVKDYDLQVDLTKRSNDLRATALLYFAQADAEDLADGSSEAFEIVPTGQPYPHWPAEGEQPPYMPFHRWAGWY